MSRLFHLPPVGVLLVLLASALGCDVLGGLDERRGERSLEGDGPGIMTSPAPAPPPEPPLNPPISPADAPSVLQPPPPADPAAIVPLGPNAKTEDEANSISVFRAVGPSTVFVTNANIGLDRFRRAVEVPVGAGSGFIWDKEGHVVTNHHVISGARLLSITLHDHKSFDARVVGSDPRKDIAVLQIVDPPAGLQPIQVDRRLELSVGQKTLAIGNPYGLDQTLTTGIISALGRSVPGAEGVTIRDMVQTDAAINPGNSGGPLLDSSGRLIGMNTMIFSRSGSSAGIGFAVPVSTIARIVPQIISGGKPDRVGIGAFVDSSQQLERKYGIRGVLLLEVAEGGPADKAGLKGGSRTRKGFSFSDVIVAVDGEAVNDYDDYYNILDRHEPGQKVKLTVQRGDQKLEFEVQLVRIP